MTPPAREGETADLQRRVEALEARLAALPSGPPAAQSLSIICFSGEWDRLFAAFTIANGALALGQDVHLFFTFWGSTALRKKSLWSNLRRNWMQNLLGQFLPPNLEAVPLSKMHFGGLGKWMMKWLMKQKGVEDLPEMMATARELGAHFYCCDTSMELFGWSREDLIDGLPAKWCGVSTFLATALKGKVTLFV